MRVIAGSARRLLLKTPAGMNTRPTTDRIKETLFNMLQRELGGKVFLDLFAGSGGIGIEALSRGAKHACFADSSREAIACVKENLTHTKLSDRATVYAMDAGAALTRMSAEKRKFDIVFLDPPYGKGLELAALSAMRRYGLLTEDATVIVETALETSGRPSRGTDPNCSDGDSGADGISELEAQGYRVTRIKEYKTNRHVFLTPTE
jgi:16S rRNA (guanine(966)-N(2))-methyltransferase RsmD